MPGDPVLANLAARRTVFDFVAQELDGLRRMRPTDVRAKLDNHYDAVGAMQSALTAAIDAFNSNQARLPLKGRLSRFGKP